MRMLAFVAALALATPLAAQTAPAPTRLTLADAAAAPSGRLIVDGATWRCEGAECVASGGSAQPATRACRRVVARVGAVTAFSWKGQALTEAEVAACNTAA